MIKNDVLISEATTGIMTTEFNKPNSTQLHSTTTILKRSGLAICYFTLMLQCAGCVAAAEVTAPPPLATPIHNLPATPSTVEQGEVVPVPPPPVRDKQAQAKQSEVMYKILTAEVAAQRQQYPVAIDYLLDAATELNDAELAQRATRLSLFAQELDMAIQAATLWVKIEPDNAEARQLLSSVLIQQDRLDEAAEQIEAMLSRLDDNTEKKIDLLSELLANHQAKQESALFLLEKLLKKRSNDAVILISYARFLIIAQQLEKAKAVLESLLKIEPYHKIGVALYVVVLNRLNEQEAALDFLKEVIAHAPQVEDDWRFMYARSLATAEKLDEAIVQFQALLTVHPENPDVLYALGLLSIQKQAYDQAEKYFKTLLDKTQNTDLANYYLGQVAELKKHPDVAISFYRQVEEGEHYLTAQARIAMLYVEKGEVERALAHIRSVPVSDDDEAAKLIQFEAELLINQKRYDEAATVYEKSLSEDPDNIELLYGRAMVLEKKDDLAGLERDLRRVLEIDPNNVEALNGLGYTLVDRTERYQEGLELIEQALKQKPDSYYILDSMGWALYRLKRYDEAIEHLEKANKIKFDAEISAHLGEVYWVTGRQQQAKALWEKALKEFPKDELLRETQQKWLKTAPKSP